MRTTHAVRRGNALRTPDGVRYAWYAYGPAQVGDGVVAATALPCCAALGRPQATPATARCASSPSSRVAPGTERARKSSTIAVWRTRSSTSKDACPVEYV